MKDVIFLLLHLITTLSKLIQPGGSRAVVAENLILKQQLIIHSRARQRAPNLTTQDRSLLGFLSQFLNPRRIAGTAIIIRPSTLLSFHNETAQPTIRLSQNRTTDQSGIRIGTRQRCCQANSRNSLPPRSQHSAACSKTLHPGRAGRNISSQITILCFNIIGGKPICACLMLKKSNQYHMCRCLIHL